MKEIQKEQEVPQRLTLRLNEKAYTFSNPQIIFFFAGTPILAILMYYFLNLRMNYWLYETISHQIAFILHVFFNLNAEVIISIDHATFPSIFIPNNPFDENFAITTNCFAAHIFTIMIAIVVCIPASRDSLPKKDFLWRKLKALVLGIVGIYLVNIFRIVLLIYFNFNGIPFEYIHESFYYLSAIVGALLFVLILKKWLPESFISVCYIYYLIRHNGRKKPLE